MAKYRSIHEKIWKDPDFELYSSESKLVFIYLCTNGSTSESGIYAITPKTISNETSIKIDSVAKILKSLKNVMWDEKNNYVYIRRFRLYNGGGAPDNIKRAIAAEFLHSSALSLWVNFVEDYPDYKETILATGKSLKPSLLPPTPPVSSSISNSNSNSIDGLVNPSPTVDQPLVLAELLKALILENNSIARVPENSDKWAKTIDLMIRKEKRTPALIEQVMRWSQSDSFWKTNILSADSLREKFDKLYMKMKSDGGTYHGNIGAKKQPPGTGAPIHYIDGDAPAQGHKD